MNDETTMLTKPDVINDPISPQESYVRAFGASISVRSLIVLLLVLTLCWMTIKLLEVKEPFYSLVVLSVGYYFGQKEKPKSQI